MYIPQLSKEGGQLVARVGCGVHWFNEQSECSLAYCHPPVADGLILHARLDDRPLRFWLDESQWCQWVAPMLVVPSWQTTPDELRELLAIWTLAEAGACRGEESRLPWPVAERLEAGAMAAGMRWKLSIRQGERRLDLYLLSAAESWLGQLADEAYPVAPENASAAIALDVSLLAGWSKIAASTLEILGPGDALLLQHSWQVADGQFGLFIGQPLATLKQFGEDDSFIIEEIMDNFDDWMDVTPSPSLITTHNNTLLNATIALTVEVAQLETSLQDLSQLEVGSLLNGKATHDGLVTLKIGGRPIAKGTLLEIDSQLAVKIDHLC
jgi:type III secretion protein Q